jgi:hypothetical protein
MTLFHDHIQKQLLECDQIAQDISREILDIGVKLEEEGLKTQANEKVIEVPHLIRLNPRVEQFLYCAKSSLRDLAQIFGLFFGKSFDEARYDKIYRWAEEEFGKDSDLARITRQDHDLWIRKLVAMRNAVEHPGGHSGHLHIHNFELVPDNHLKFPALNPPSWHLNDEPKAPIAESLLVAVSNILELCEDMLVICINMSGLPEIIAFAEIPDEERNPDCPVRLRAVLKK